MNARHLETSYQRAGPDRSGATAYVARVSPDSWEEAKVFREASAVGYELVLICGKDGALAEVQLRVDQCPHGDRNFAPSSAPAWLFPLGSTFVVDWDDLAAPAQERVLKMLSQVVEESGRPVGQ